MIATIDVDDGVLVDERLRTSVDGIRAAGEDEPFDYLVYFFSDAFDLSWEYWSDQTDADRVVYRGSLDDGSFSAWWLDGEHVAVAFVIDRPDEDVPPGE